MSTWDQGQSAVHVVTIEGAETTYHHFPLDVPMAMDKTKVLWSRPLVSTRIGSAPFGSVSSAPGDFFMSVERGRLDVRTWASVPGYEAGKVSSSEFDVLAGVVYPIHKVGNCAAGSGLFSCLLPGKQD